MSVPGKISDYYPPCPALTYDCGHKLPLGPKMFVELQSVGRDARQPVPLGAGNCAMRACPPQAPHVRTANAVWRSTRV